MVAFLSCRDWVSQGTLRKTEAKSTRLKIRIDMDLRTDIVNSEAVCVAGFASCDEGLIELVIWDKCVRSRVRGFDMDN
jgi:hypothetical protein